MKVRSVSVGRVWDCMLCTSVSEQGGDGEGVGSEASSLLSYTLRYVSLAELGSVCQFVLFHLKAESYISFHFISRTFFDF